MRTLVTSIVLFMLGLSAQTALAQLDTFLQPFNAKAGGALAIKSADSSMTSVKLIGVFTVGDTTSTMQLPIETVFDIKNGKSKVWAYFLTGQSRHTNTDTSKIVAVVNVLFLGFQVFPFDASSLKQLVSFATELPENWIDSDEMAAKITANDNYKLFAGKYPDKKPLLIPLSVAVVSRFFPIGSPLWALSFGSMGSGGGIPNGPVLTCEVHATTGETKCEEIALAAEESLELNDNFVVIPNPAIESMRFAVPSAMRGYEITTSVVNMLGQVVLYSGVETSHAETIVLPTAQLPAGTYYLICSANGRTVRTVFTVIK